MQLSEILEPACIAVPLEVESKQEAIFALVDRLAEQRGIAAVDELKEAVWERETTRTTGIGHGVAIPHGKCPGCHELSMAVGRPATPLDFQAVDGEPVDLIFLLVSPENQTGPHIQALANISRLLTDADLRQSLREAESPESFYERIVEHEKALG